MPPDRHATARAATFCGSGRTAPGTAAASTRTARPASTRTVVGLVVHQPHGRCEGAGALAHGLADRPQPRRVDVGVADGHDAASSCARAGTASAGRQTARAAAAVPGTSAMSRASNADSSVRSSRCPRGSSSGERASSRRQHLDVEQQLEHRVVTHGQIGVAPAGTAAGRRRWRASRSTWGGRPRASTGSTRPRRTPRTVRRQLRQRHAGAPRVDALQRSPVGPHQALGLEAGTRAAEAEVDHHLELRAGPLGGRRRRCTGTTSFPMGGPTMCRSRTARTSAPKPRRRNTGSPGASQASTVIGVDRGMHRRQHALPQLTLDPLLDEDSIVVHAATLDASRAAAQCLDLRVTSSV